MEPLSRKVASAFVMRGMQKGDVALYLTSDVTRIFTVIIGAWRVGGIMYSSYPEDTQGWVELYAKFFRNSFKFYTQFLYVDTLLMRIRESNARWIFCDPPSVPQCKEALAQVDWPVEIFTFGRAEGTTCVDELFENDGKGMSSVY